MMVQSTSRRPVKEPGERVCCFQASYLSHVAGTAGGTCHLPFAICHLPHHSADIARSPVGNNSPHLADMITALRMEYIIPHRSLQPDDGCRLGNFSCPSRLISTASMPLSLAVYCQLRARGGSYHNPVSKRKANPGLCCRNRV